MNLTIDIGNTRNKIAIFDQNKLVKSETLNELNKDLIENFIANKKIDGIILCSVKEKNIELINYLESTFDFFIDLNEYTNIPIKNLYDSKSTLGKDRLAAVIGANNIYPKSNVLVIDMGTAITFDFINKKDQYLGGSISPGLKHGHV